MKIKLQIFYVRSKSIKYKSKEDNNSMRVVILLERTHSKSNKYKTINKKWSKVILKC
jgi:hypothetical protein